MTAQHCSTRWRNGGTRSGAVAQVSPRGGLRGNRVLVRSVVYIFCGLHACILVFEDSLLRTSVVWDFVSGSHSNPRFWWKVVRISVLWDRILKRPLEDGTHVLKGKVLGICVGHFCGSEKDYRHRPCRPHPCPSCVLSGERGSERVLERVWE